LIILPAIDLKEGRVVRLKQGDFKKETVYSRDPLIIAEQFMHKGADWLHIVDLDGANLAESRNLNIIKKIREEIPISIQCGGGIRSIEDVQRLDDIGIDRIIIGTLAVKKPDLLSQIISEFTSEKILISLDAREGKIRTSGWKEESSIDLIEFAVSLEKKGIKHILYTDIKRDGMLSGPDIKGLTRLKKETGLNIIASGGISSLCDIERLNKLDFYGVIIGQALYQKKFDLKEAIKKVGD